MINVRTAFAAAIVAGFASTASFAQTASEAQTSQAVVAQIDKDAALRADTLHVETTGTTVYLTGQVDSAIESDDAVKAAQSVPNVGKVVNLLALASN